MERIHIAFFGPTNSGKSTLVNAIAGQRVSLVSDVPGTTTDPVRKAVELPGLGPCILIDTAGIYDTGVLGAGSSGNHWVAARTRMFSKTIRIIANRDRSIARY